MARKYQSANDIPTGLLKSLLDYNPATGDFLWKARPKDMFATERAMSSWNSRHAGTPALIATFKGYRRGMICHVRVRAHRVAFAMVHGYWPEMVDHINGDRADNRIENLRAANCEINSKNRSFARKSKSGVAGVYWEKKRKMWNAQIMLKQRQYFLGYYNTLEEATAARKRAEAELGFHPNHGRSPTYLPAGQANG